MKIRLVHTQAEKGAILITDIDEGVDREFLDTERKQNCYVTYNKKSFTKSGTGVLAVVTDTDVPGFTDLVESDKVMLSRAHGDIAGLAAKGLVDVIEIPAGVLDAPTIATVTQTAAGDVTITGTNFESFDPDVTSVSIDETVIDAGDITVDSAQITVSTGIAYDAGEEVVVTANGNASNAVAVDHTA